MSGIVIVGMFGLAVMFGIQAKPQEMGIIVVAGAIVLAFINIDRIEYFKGLGFEAKMKKAIENVNATIEQLRKVATTSSKATLTGLMADNFMDGTTLETRLTLHDQLISNLKDIGVSSAQIEEADEMWKRGVGVIFHRGIRHTLEGRKEKNQINTTADQVVLEASREFQDLLQFDEWKAPSSDEMRHFIEGKGLMNSEIEDLLNDYKMFETTGELKRREVFIKL